MSYGPNPWQQLHWDARAAANFMAGGAGSGLVVAAALAAAPGWVFLAGLALVGAGLFAVWLEIGRPWRAANVMRHARLSWMTREAFAALALFAVFGVGFTAAGWSMGTVAPATAALGGVAGAVFVYCQGRILRAARGIPAWREPLIVPLIVATGLAEGAGLFVLLQLGGAPAAAIGWFFVASLVARAALWLAWRRRLGAAGSGADRRALAAIDRAGHVFNGTTLAALAAALLALLALPAPLLSALWPLAGALALAGGQWFKFTLVTRAAFNQGFALPHLPVRGVRPALPRPPAPSR